MTELCDRCGAPSKTRFVKNDSELFFCGHHTREFRMGLVAAGFEVDFDKTSNHALVTA